MSTELVPAENLAALDTLDPAARELAVTRMLGEARSWLAHAVEATEPAAVANFRAFVATVAETTRQLGLSREIQLDATEMVRRAERGVGVAIRTGQQNGEIAKQGDKGHMPPPGGGVRPGEGVRGEHLQKSSDYFLGSKDRAETYALTDVSVEQFEQAIGEAKAEGNLSRANVVRKIKGEPARATNDRHELLYKTRHINSHRVIAQTVLQVADPCPPSLFEFVDYTGLDPDEITEWVSSLSASINALRSLKVRLERELTHD